MPAEPKYNPGLHRIALVTACATFPLIFMGGLVTSHGAGMSVPDWPNSYGYNMFLFPPKLWIGGILYEHTHRLMATVVGLCAIVLTGWAWKTEARRWVRWLATGVLGAVIFQGILGGLRVVLIKLDLAVVHACFAQAFFCLAAMTAVVTSRWWFAAPDLSAGRDSNGGRKLLRLATTAVLAIYLQLIAGAVMRHYQAGLAIPDLPLAYGKLLPPANASELAAVNSIRAKSGGEWFYAHNPNPTSAQQAADPVTLAQVWVHFTHRVGAVVVTIILSGLIAYSVSRHRVNGLLVPAVLLIGLLLTQLTLGVLTVLLRKPADIASSHVAVGALTLMTTFVLLVRSARLYRPRPAGERAGFEVITDRDPVSPAPAAAQRGLFA